MTEVVPTGEVHPVAALFPMLPEDELQELADSIQANGLREPLDLDCDGRLVDGRNRWAACQIANTDPRFNVLPKETDVVAYILDKNINRRHMNKGQRAMATVMAYEATNNLSLKAVAKSASLNREFVRQAAAVNEYAPDITGEVLTGTLALNDAYIIAQETKREKATAAERAEENKRLLSELRQAAPDLAERVAEETLSFAEAITLWREREREELERRRRNVTYFDGAVTMLWSLLDPGTETFVDEWIDGVANKLQVDHLSHLRTGSGLRDLADLITACAAAVDRRGELS